MFYYILRSAGTWNLSVEETPVPFPHSEDYFVTLKVKVFLAALQLLVLATVTVMVAFVPFLVPFFTVILPLLEIVIFLLFDL